ncbi:hypothetical protein [Serratia phage vB_SspM_LC53]|nr:hypothetical protein [Serratia phage vB_SspM_LC53]
MSIEDIKGYKPHTDEKISKVNKIKDLEIALGQVFTELETELSDEYSNAYGWSTEVLDELLERTHQIQLAKERLKEASMWACRAVFRPEEKY